MLFKKEGGPQEGPFRKFAFVNKTHFESNIMQRDWPLSGAPQGDHVVQLVTPVAPTPRVGTLKRMRR
jgi:hypothetical protein